MFLHQSPRFWGPLGLGPPGFACSESIVVITPEDSTCQGESHECANFYLSDKQKGFEKKYMHQTCLNFVKTYF
jgi:hypothetical protein